LPVVVTLEAQQDLLDARDWYDRQRNGLGEEFSAEVASLFDRLSATPKLFAYVWRDVRACRPSRFPYIVHYRAHDDRVEVLAVLHASRDRSAWRSRV
jgi:plasmid stabilization system protein ParE